MDDLIARLEAAPEGSRELDAEIALATGWSLAAFGDSPEPLWLNPAGEQAPLPASTTALDAKLPGEEIVEMKWYLLGGRGDVCVATQRGGHHAYAATEPLARRAARLKAIQHERM